MKRTFLILLLTIFSLTMSGCINSNVEVDNKSQATKSIYRPLTDVALCKGSLDGFTPVDKDTCNSINATETNKQNYCGKILNTERKNICYLAMAKRLKNFDTCNLITDNKIKSSCNVYVINVKPDDDIEKNIYLSRKDADISKQITNIQTLFTQKGDMPQNLLQQQLEVIINKANEKRFALENNNYNLD